MINKVILIGRLTKDVELRRTTTGKAVASFTLAVDSMQKDAEGNKVSSFIPCNAWEKVAEALSKYTHKGSLIAVEGSLVQRSYDSKEGKKVSVIEVLVSSIQLLESKQQANAVANQKMEEEIKANEKASNPVQSDIKDDDLPF